MKVFILAGRMLVADTKAAIPYNSIPRQQVVFLVCYSGKTTAPQSHLHVVLYYPVNQDLPQFCKTIKKREEGREKVCVQTVFAAKLKILFCFLWKVEKDLM